MTEFKSWEELSERERLECTYSDAYKDAYGFRPRGVNIAGFTLEELKGELQHLEEIIGRNMRAEHEAQQKAIAAFEARVHEVMTMMCINRGDCNRADAIRWIQQAEGAEGQTLDYLCYLEGLPYGYLDKPCA